MSQLPERRNLQPASFEEFEREAAPGNVVPVVRTMLADLQTPLGAFLAVADGARYSFLLESAEGGERLARYSFLGARPWMVVRGRGKRTFIEVDGRGTAERDMCAWDFIREHFRSRELSCRHEFAPLAGGAVGYLSYEAAQWFEPR
ncbi:MAG: anthranilate synthase component I, partial [Acidobacteria bacterium]|nr:anthranilate synthase component I [Acidobacteriota bacterium]